MKHALAVPVLHEDADVLVVDKPAGMLTIPGRGEEEAPDVQAFLEQLRGEKLWVVHRLDRGTSGCLAFARHADAHRNLCQAFEAGRVGKRYLALVQGHVAEPMGEIDRPLIAARRGKMRPAAPGEDGKPSLTVFKVRERFEKFSWLELEPRTGRQHQLRVHLASVGHPLAVDETYRSAERLTERDFGGDSDAVVLARTPLHCQWLSLPGPRDVPIMVEAPLPLDLIHVLDLLRGAEVTDPTRQRPKLT